MPNIHIRKTHQLDNDSIRKEIDKLAHKLAQELSAEYHWEGDRLLFKRSGASGQIEVGQDQVVVDIKLGMLLKPLQGSIEKTVKSYLDERLG